MRGAAEGGEAGRPREASQPEAGGSESGRSEAVDRADYDPGYDPRAPIHCEVCGGEMFYTAACKLKCPRCGYMRDCSDP